MALTGVPLLIFVPGTYTEIAPSRISGLAIQPHESLLIGQRSLTGSSMTAGQIYEIDSVPDAIALAGAGSQLALMAAGYRSIDSLTPLSMLAVDAAGASAQAEGTITITGTATESRPLALYVSGVRYVVAVATGDTAAAVTSKAQAAIDADRLNLGVTLAAAAGVLTFTAKAGGTYAHQIQLGHSQLPGERPPAGITVAVVALAGGGADPSLSAAITAIGDDQYQTIVSGLATGLNDSLVPELERRWGPLVQADGVCFAGFAGARSDISDLADDYNSALLCLIGTETSSLLEPSWVLAAKVAALSAQQAQIDPSLSPCGDVLTGSRAAKKGTRFTFEQRNTLLGGGVSTLAAAPDGRLAVERLVTTYRKNAQGLPDTALRDLAKIRTLSALRFSFRAMVSSKYSKAKLMDDSPIVPAGQVIMTPDLMAAEICALSEQWADAGWVESGSLKRFRQELVVQRSASDSSRLEALLPPDIMDQLYVTAARIQAVG